MYNLKTLRIWFSGRTRPCQGRDPGSIPGVRIENGDRSCIRFHMKQSFNIPAEVTHVTQALESAHYEAYLVGGCVRDLIIGKEPKDWDITTNATPPEIQKLFPRSFYENDYGTVGIVIHETGDRNKDIVEVTPYRLETKYSDKRHPDEIIFSNNLEDDLKRRDFTINSVAYSPSKGQITDPFGGQKDISDKIIRAVGSPKDRLTEDALRILRAVRLATTLDFQIETELVNVIHETAHTLNKISIERINDELVKIIMSKNPMQGIQALNNMHILKHILPELEEGIGVEQNGDHIYHVWEHNLRALQHSADRGWPLHVRLGAMLHDVGKPKTRFWSKEKNDWTFYGHDVVGAKMSAKIMARLHFSKKISDVVTKLVRYHLFFSDVNKITLSAVRRIVKNVGAENVWDLMKVRACDRIGMGRPKETPYRLRKYEAMIEEAMRSPTSVGMLKIDGAKIMEVTQETPGPRIGFILHALLEEALDSPELNTPEYLQNRAVELSKITEEELLSLGKKGKGKKEAIEAKEIAEIRKRHWVK